MSGNGEWAAADAAGGGAAPQRGFVAHRLRAEIVGEIHARPFRAARPPRLFLHHAFAVDRAATEADRAFLERFCRGCGVAGPGPEARHHVVTFAGGTLKWERHAEFVTYTWDGAPREPALPFADLPSNHPFGTEFVQPGPMLVAARLDLVADPGDLTALRAPFDPASLCISEAYGGEAVTMTDFRQDGDGRTRILVVARGLAEPQTGALVQRLLEIETYRTLAMLGLPLAQALAPEVRRLEHELAAITSEIRATEGLAANRGLLERLSALSAEVENRSADASYRFGATRAYDQIVADRLAILDERATAGWSTWASFLARRSKPAMRTVAGLHERMGDLSKRAARTAQLLRTRVDVDLEQQNRDLLHSMNRRARQQLLLQQTVEGLSVAAVSYYVVGLVGYVFKAAKEAHLVGLDPGLATGIAVPFVIGAVFWLVRRIRKAHAPDGDGH